MMLTKY